MKSAPSFLPRATSAFVCLCTKSLTDVEFVEFSMSGREESIKGLTPHPPQISFLPGWLGWDWDWGWLFDRFCAIAATGASDG
jgi:hypothetical protein